MRRKERQREKWSFLFSASDLNLTSCLEDTHAPLTAVRNVTGRQSDGGPGGENIINE